MSRAGGTVGGGGTQRDHIDLLRREGALSGFGVILAHQHMEGGDRVGRRAAASLAERDNPAELDISMVEVVELMSCVEVARVGTNRRICPIAAVCRLQRSGSLDPNSHAQIVGRIGTAMVKSSAEIAAGSRPNASGVEMPFQILCLSGGGFLGLYSASIVADLEKEFGGPIARHFDLIAGTSIGGIIALGLANEVPGQEIKSAFERNGTQIFSDRHAPRSGFGRAVELARSILSSKYDEQPLRTTITSIVGERTRIGDLRHRCLVPAVNLSKGGPQVFKTDHHIDFRQDLHLRAVDVAMATSAAPTYFPVAQVGDALYADGGLYANSPDLLALHEAEHFMKIPTEDIRMLSIGTTTSKFSFFHGRRRNFGAVNWAMGARLVQTMISSQQQLVDFLLGHKLGDRYVRLDSEQSKEQAESLSLDTAHEGAQRTIRALASAEVQRAVNDQHLRALFVHTAAEPTFFHRQKLAV